MKAEVDIAAVNTSASFPLAPPRTYTARESPTWLNDVLGVVLAAQHPEIHATVIELAAIYMVGLEWVRSTETKNLPMHVHKAAFAIRAAFMANAVPISGQ